MTTPMMQSQDFVLRGIERARYVPEFVPRAMHPTAVTTQSFTDANVADSILGMYAIPDDGDAVGQMRQILTRTGTQAFVDQPWLSMTGVTKIRIWHPNDVPFLVTAADAAAPFDAVSTRYATGYSADFADMADDAYKGFGYAFLWKAGGNIGAAKAITDSTLSTGSFDAGAPAATAVGDLADIRKIVHAIQDIEAEVSNNVIERMNFGAGELDADVPIITTNTGHVNLVVAHKPLPAAAGSGVQASKPIEMGDVLEDVFNVFAGTGGTVTDASTPGIITASAGVFRAGDFFLAKTGEAGQAYDVSTDGTDITAMGTGHVTGASIQAGSVLHAGVNYRRKTDNWRTCLWDLYRGARLRQIFHECLPSISMTITREALITWALNYMSANAQEYHTPRPVAVAAAFPMPLGDNGIPRDGKGARLILDGIKMKLDELTMDWGFKPLIRGTLGGMNQSDGCIMDTGPISGTLRCYADMNDVTGFRTIPDRVNAQKPMQLLYQNLTAQTKVFVVGAPAVHFKKRTFQYNERQGMFSVEFTCVKPTLSGYSVDLPAASFAQI